MPNRAGLVPAAARELSAALGEHRAVVRVAEACLAKSAGTRDSALKAIRAEPFATLDVDQPLGDRVEPEVATALPGYLDAGIYLSHAIAIARGEMAGKAVIEELVTELFEWTIVVTGLFTTILISVKAFASPRSRGYLSMAVMAIVLSSLGTAVATLNSFYTPTP